MKPKIDFTECLKDSPRFRASLEQSEHVISDLEGKLERLIKYSNGMVDAGKAYSSSIGYFVNGLKEVKVHFKDDSLVKDSVGRFITSVSEMQNYHAMLFDQIHRAISNTLSGFVREEIKKVKETKKVFDKISDDLDSAYAKHAQVNKAKPGEAEEVYNVLTATRSAFAHTALDYVCQISMVESRKRYEILNTILSFIQAQSTFYHQGHDLLQESNSFFKHLSSQLEELQTEAEAEKKEMEKRHNLVNDLESIINKVPTDRLPHEMEGYLFKRASNAFKTWNRRWFVIQNNQLIYQKKLKDTPTVVADLRLCTVKVANEIERRFCFEIVSPTKTCVVQADTENIRLMWMQSIDSAIKRSFSDNANLDNISQDKSENDEIPLATSEEALSPTASAAKAEPSMLTKLQSIPGNDKCCDCKAPNPRWASINLGITLCIQCSGIHRSFGVHMSKVRSLTLDAWEPETLKVMAEIGNNKVNKIYEANVNEGSGKRATEDCDRDVRESWIRAKYADKKFVKKLPLATSKEDVQRQDQKPVRRWSVTKHHRRKSKKKSESSVDLSTETNPKVGTSSSSSSPASLSAGTLSDSGIGSSDVLVFGSSLERNDLLGEGIKKPEDIDDIQYILSSEGSDVECVDDVKTIGTTTTSLEDLSKLHPNMLLYKAAGANNLPVMLEAVANGASVNWVNSEDHGRCPLHQAVFGGSLAACDFLLLNGAKVNTRDANGRGVLHHATMLGHTGQVCLFLKRGADQHAVDEDGQDALKIALTTTNADIVTLLRNCLENGVKRGRPETLFLEHVDKTETGQASRRHEEKRRAVFKFRR
ncbi:arf-GAP with coiled-coil, ANK repeat and PH domain-containing protein 2-like isoform X2 [Ptychodera flava]|uniref:arf-GAP with coiled-coil, ANK repeat and PH domain-containing protein 2-like isoform X2 n=1 Tax=Ptychodera flava TaxID=63121 RepID=UPI003969FEEC